MHKVSDVRQIEVHKAELLVPDPRRLEVEIAIEMSKKHKSPGSAQIPAELIQAGGEILLSEITNSLILFRMRKNCLTNGRNLLFYQFTKRVIKHSNNYRGISLLSKSKSHYDRQLVSQSVLVSDPHQGPATNFIFSLTFSLDSCGFVIL
jgi:hypothetical protein